MKCFLSLVLLALLVLTFFTYRSRVRSAFKVLALSYAVIIGINIVRASNDEQSSGTVIAVLVGLVALWAVGWLGVSLWNRYRANTNDR